MNLALYKEDIIIIIIIIIVEQWKRREGLRGDRNTKGQERKEKDETTKTEERRKRLHSRRVACSQVSQQAEVSGDVAC